MFVFNPCERVGMFMLWGLSKDETMDEVGAEVDGGLSPSYLKEGGVTGARLCCALHSSPPSVLGPVGLVRKRRRREAF